ncbi:MAG: peptide ABC transporter substrate-binding protein [Anaerolineaceae bacterium]
MRKNLNHSIIQILTSFAALVILVSGCAPAPISPTPTIALPNVSVAPTAVPERLLTICVGQEPDTLYPYAGSSRSMWSVLEAIYDGPIDTIKYQAQPVILEKLPSRADGDIKITPVKVQEGDEVVNNAGEVVGMNAGMIVRPAGCNSTECEVAWDGASDLLMDQMTAAFKLLPGLKWSDGQPLTAADSVYSFQLASDPATPVSRRQLERTSSYLALDETTVEWKGKPGFMDSRPYSNFYLPMPRHAWEKISAADLLKSPQAAEKPLGWGPYMISEWIKGDHIKLVKNPNYIRAAEGLPKFETLVFRFLGEKSDNNLAALQAGECDVVDQTSMLEEQLETVLDLQKNGKLKAFVGQGPEWEQIAFGVKPGSFDDGGISPATGDRADFFGDVRMRQAFAYCMDRKTAVDKQLLGQSAIPNGFFTSEHPLFMADLPSYPYDVAKGSQLLTEVGWKDHDNDPTTPRLSDGVMFAQGGTPLEVTLVTTDAYLRQEVVKKLAETMAPCGMKVNVQSLPADQVYGPGPDGLVFGRKFDLAQIAWQAGAGNPCFLYESIQIPTAVNHWLGVNITGYANPAYDAACQTARAADSSQPDYQVKNDAAQTLFAQELPALPLYFNLKIVAARPDFCGIEMDVTARSALWNIENFDFGESCPK